MNTLQPPIVAARRARRVRRCNVGRRRSRTPAPPGTARGLHQRRREELARRRRPAFGSSPRRRSCKTPFVKIVVTGDDGRYVLPQLPTATYNVWVRGYGLADSDRVEGRPGDTALDLTAKLASHARRSGEGVSRQLLVVAAAAAGAERIPGHGRERQRHPAGLKVQGQWINNIKSQCNFCHQLGKRSRARSVTWTTSASRRPRTRGSTARSSACAAARWPARFAVFGVQAGAQGVRRLDDAHRQRRVAAAAAAPAAGVERNVVVTLWDWGNRAIVHARRDFDRQERSDRERLRPGVRRLRRPRPAHGRSIPSRTARTKSRFRRARTRARSARGFRRRRCPRTSGAWSTSGASRIPPIRTTR